MGVEIRKRVAGREIDVVIHSGDFVPGHQLAWCSRVRGNCCRSREGGRLGRRRQREYTLRRRRFAAPRGRAGRRALFHGRCRVRVVVASCVALLLSAQRQSQKRAHRQCCTPIAHLIPPELYPANPVWFTRPSDTSQLFNLLLLLPQAPTPPHTPVPPREKPEEAKGRGAVRLFHNSLSLQLLPRSPGRLLGQMASAAARSHESQCTAHALRLSLALLSTVNFPILRYTSLLMDSITTLDNLWMGRPRSIAAGLLESDGHRAVIDPGPGSTLETLHQQLQARGVGVGDLDAILLTHIHLDHAGATGALVRENPRLAVYVHKNGAPHMADPSKLLAPAARLWGDDLPRLFGETLPVPAENLRILEGGETLPLGVRKLDVVYTPGHASHHVSYFDNTKGVVFVGDTAGVRIDNAPYILPATPPPDIDLSIWDKSMDTILARRPARLFLTHFGYADNPAPHIAEFRERLHQWAEVARECLRTAPDEAAALEMFVAKSHREMQ